MRLQPGDGFDRYTVEALLGEGGMGEVYRALDTKLHRRIALKVLRSPKQEGAPGAGPSPDAWRAAAAQVLREARAAAALNHPNAVAIYDVGEHEGAPFIAMELVEGSSLRSFVGGDAPVEVRLRWLCDVGTALSAAHRAGLVHRDVKPENVMLREDGVIKVLDFGIARSLQAAPDGNTPTLDPAGGGAAALSGALIGTPAYMAPEQLRGDPIDGRADQFSWGVLAYEILSGRLPFGAGRDVIAILADLLSRDAPPLEGVPDEVAQAVQRALAKAPDDRFASMDELLDAIAPFADEAQPPPSRGRARPSVVEMRSAGGAISVTAPPPRRLRAPWPLVAGAGAAAAVALGGWLALSGRPAAPAPAPPSETAAPVVPAPTPITQIAPPKTDSAEALAAYQEGLQALRDAAWFVAHDAFLRATQRDPRLAAAHLRLAMTSWYLRRVTDAREMFQEAMQLRGTLGERDQHLLEALEPLIQREPSDHAEAVRRAEAAAARYPGDAELAGLLLLLQEKARPEKQLELAERCLALDPQYADCWQGKALALWHLDRIDDALGTLQRCIEVTPSSLDCLGSKATIERATGRCARFEETARSEMAKSPKLPAGYRNLAAALYALGRPAESVRTALQQAWLRDPEPRKERARLLDETRLALAAGRFAEAEKHALALRGKVALETTNEAHREPTSLLIGIYQELGKDEQAGKIAEAALVGLEIWMKPARMTVLDDRTVELLRARQRAGAITEAQHAAARAAWLEAWAPKLPDEMRGVDWLMAWAAPAGTPAEAKEALERAPDLTPIRSYLASPVESAVLGRLYLLGGRPAEALPWLRRAAGDCSALLEPLRHTIATYHLGEALAATGDRDGACAAFGVVQGRWGGERASRTAQAAAARAKALGCAR